MTECVISPWLFYAMGVCEALSAAACAVLFVLVITGIFLPIATDVFYDLRCRNAIKWYLAALVITLLLVIFVPTKNTVIQMLIAKNVTYELVGQTTDVVQQVYMDILALFE